MNSPINDFNNLYKIPSRYVTLFHLKTNDMSKNLLSAEVRRILVNQPQAVTNETTTMYNKLPLKG